MTVPLTDSLRQEYQSLFDSCAVNAGQLGTVNHIVSQVMPNRARYHAVGDPLGIPWFFVAVIHNMESSLKFTGHLHNGDPLTARTVHEPPGRPPASVGNPPFTWEQSAGDALRFDGFANRSEWTIATILYRLEAFNGFGYRRLVAPIPTPYLWSFSNHYSKGKFVRDGVFDPEAVSGQCGAAVILLQMKQGGLITFDLDPAPVPQPAPELTPSQLAARFDNVVRFSTRVKSDAARALQNALNTFPGIHVTADGFPGRQTSDAYNQVTGHFLAGDPLA